jgi:hypothetical protein
MLPRRPLEDLVSVGRATLGDFARLGMPDAGRLARPKPLRFSNNLSRMVGQLQDISRPPVFRSADAGKLRLPAEQWQF